jgi:hypothetical protein
VARLAEVVRKHLLVPVAPQTQCSKADACQGTAVQGGIRCGA